jgi:accessory gene regulator protein AgrB
MEHSRLNFTAYVKQFLNIGYFFAYLSKTGKIHLSYTQIKYDALWYCISHTITVGASEHKILSLLTVSAAPCAFSFANSHNNWVAMEGTLTDITSPCEKTNSRISNDI